MQTLTVGVILSHTFTYSTHTHMHTHTGTLLLPKVCLWGKCICDFILILLLFFYLDEFVYLCVFVIAEVACVYLCVFHIYGGQVAELS